MKLTFLGTGAGESYPGLWCQCPHCSYARKHGGKNIRSNSCAVIDETLLLDIGPACFDNAARFGVNLCEVTTLLITHPHEDHFYPRHLYWRKTDESHLDLDYIHQMNLGGSRFTPIPELDVYGSRYAVEALSNFQQMRMRVSEVHSGDCFTSSGYHITPVMGNHDRPEFAYSYIIRKDGRTMLYALDTGDFCEESQEILKQYTYNLIVMEGTTGLNEQYGGHMCLNNNLKWKRFFEDNGCCTEDYRFILSHMSPHWCPPHDWYEAIVEPEGLILA